jgi:hypothetical protein
VTDTLMNYPLRAGGVTFSVDRVTQVEDPENVLMSVDRPRVLDGGDVLPGAVEDYGLHVQVNVDGKTYGRLEAALKKAGQAGGVTEHAATASPNMFLGAPMELGLNVSIVVDHGERLERDGNTVQAVTINRVRLPLAVVQRDGVDVAAVQVGSKTLVATWVSAVKTVTMDGFVQDHVYRMPADEPAALYLVTHATRTRALRADTLKNTAYVRVPAVGPLHRNMPTNQYGPKGSISRRVRGELRDRQRSVFDDPGPADRELVIRLDEDSQRLAAGGKVDRLQGWLPLGAVTCNVKNADQAMMQVLSLFRTDLLVSIDAAMALAVERGGSTTLTLKDLAAVRHGGTTGLNTQTRTRLRQHVEVLQTVGFTWQRTGKREALTGKLFTPELREVVTGKPRLFFLASPLMNTVKNGKGHFVPRDLLRLNMKTHEWEYRWGRYLAGRLSDNSARLHQYAAGGDWTLDVPLNTLMDRAGLRGDHRRDMGLENYRRRLDSVMGFLVNMGLLADARLDWNTDMSTATVVVTAGQSFRQAVMGERPRVFTELAVRPVLPAGLEVADRRKKVADRRKKVADRRK